MSSTTPRQAPRPLWPARRRGSVLITALILSAIIAISLASYLRLALHTLRLADRSFYQNAALNLAELGFEHALYCYNRLATAASPETAWTGADWPAPASDGSIRRKFSGIELGAGVLGEVAVYCSAHNPGSGITPVIAVRSTVTFAAGGPPLTKYMEITLRRRSLFAHGMVARNSIVWNGGNASADSWNSDPDNNAATAAVGYGSPTGPARAGASVGTPSAEAGALDFGGGVIRGRVMNGGGTISRTGSAILSNSTTGTGWDSSLVSNDFSATFPPVVVPEPPAAARNRVTSTTPIAVPSSLPRPGDVAWNGVYFYDFASLWTLSASGPATNRLTIGGPVVFLATSHSGRNVIDLAGNASIAVSGNATLRVYTDGNVEAAGNGITNANASPATLQIYGTNPTVGGQTIRFVGNGSASATIYAPNATFQLRGNGALQGSVIANTINLNGNAAFHYDEALGSLSAGNPFGIVKWRELQSSEERALYAARLNF
ncbi:MAG: hypothetical protein HZC55_06160 [Verrucomicrobia bacterium]|nr:hypothetical protein [Verrucomicrobiota bacterium]